MEFDCDSTSLPHSKINSSIRSISPGSNVLGRNRSIELKYLKEDAHPHLYVKKIVGNFAKTLSSSWGFMLVKEIT